MTFCKGMAFSFHLVAGILSSEMVRLYMSQHNTTYKSNGINVLKCQSVCFSLSYFENIYSEGWLLAPKLVHISLHALFLTGFSAIKQCYPSFSSAFVASGK